MYYRCLLYTSDAADDSLRVDLGGRRIIKKISRPSARGAPAWRCGMDRGFFQAEDGIRDRSPSRGLGDVYKRQLLRVRAFTQDDAHIFCTEEQITEECIIAVSYTHLTLPTTPYV